MIDSTTTIRNSSLLAASFVDQDRASERMVLDNTHSLTSGFRTNAELPRVITCRISLTYVGRRRKQQNIAQSRGAHAGPTGLGRPVLLGLLRVLRRGSEARNADLRGYPLTNLVSTFYLWAGRHRWAAVEMFIRTACGHMRTQDYRVFAEKSHRWFHPD